MAGSVWWFDPCGLYLPGSAYTVKNGVSIHWVMVYTEEKGVNREIYV